MSKQKTRLVVLGSVRADGEPILLVSAGGVMQWRCRDKVLLDLAEAAVPLDRIDPSKGNPAAYAIHTLEDLVDGVGTVNTRAVSGPEGIEKGNAVP